MLKWVDTLDIAIELSDKYPDEDPQWINFVDLRNLVLNLE
jgi:FeS assembly protein IscX